MKSTDDPKCCLCGGNHPASYLACPRNPINHAPKQKSVAPKENHWRRRAANSTPLQEAENPSPTIINNEDFPPLPSKPAPTRTKPKSTETPTEDPFSILRSEAGRMAALFKFIEEEED
ncbi:hypothetical protein NPIL_690221 [Nephila pilipes]|uniref:Uncharacterized protein n=1 Tax=Nephila pilipes TaxID=299642 RepID=A0A8X6I5A5_NEPPI|nr:hypothetical protein NPIL_690221 [Nephila pilipes]